MTLATCVGTRGSESKIPSPASDLDAVTAVLRVRPQLRSGCDGTCIVLTKLNELFSVFDSVYATPPWNPRLKRFFRSTSSAL
jgi:hypothetical protein